MRHTVTCPNCDHRHPITYANTMGCPYCGLTLKEAYEKREVKKNG